VERLWHICQIMVLIDYLIDLIDNLLGQKQIFKEFHAKKMVVQGCPTKTGFILLILINNLIWFDLNTAVWLADPHVENFGYTW